MTTTVRVYTCAAQSNEGERTPPLSNVEEGTCAAGTGAWTTVSVPAEFPVMDVVSVLLVFGMCVCAALGYAAGRQR